MSFLIRVQLPDEPGALGALAEAFGSADANIRSVDVVEATDGFVIDDIVIELPQGRMADELITASNSVPGTEVDSIRPFSGRVDRRGQITMLADIARAGGNRTRAVETFVPVMPRTMTASWALVLDTEGEVRRLAASEAAPEEDGSVPADIEIAHSRPLDPEGSDAWVPESWTVLETALAAAPLADTGLLLVIGRLGGPDFLASEVSHLGEVATIIGKLLD